MNVFQATRLQTMYQELLPLGFNPDQVFEENLRFMERITESQSTLTVDFEFDVLVNPPELNLENGTLIVSMHLGEHFGCIPMYLARRFAGGVPFTFLMSRAARQAVPEWKDAVYTRAENELNIEILYVEDSHSLLSLARRLKRGGVVFAYLDAVVPGQASNRTVDVNLLSHPIEMPAGVVELALNANACIHPVFASETDYGNQLTFLDLDSNESDVHKTMTALASFFGRGLLANPGRWTQWDYCSTHRHDVEPLVIQGMPYRKSSSMEYQGHEYLFNYQQGIIEQV